ncbi:MAG: DUF1134 domain-containing protein [Panacagrimonas sp.]
MRQSILAFVLSCGLLPFGLVQAQDEQEEQYPVSQEPYTAEEIAKAANNFFGETAEGLARIIEKVFAEQGQPNAYIVGEEAGGAFAFGLRYGQGTLQYKGGDAVTVHWKGPSIGWDFGGNAARVLTLVYGLQTTDQLYKRFPGVDGSLYFVAGAGVNYQRSEPVTLAPIRTGLGWRAGASVGYLHYTPTKSWWPF